jgi:hypothetical protein
MAKASPNRQGGDRHQTTPSRYTVFLMVPNTTTARAVVYKPNGDPHPGAPISFYMNGNLVVGNYQTGEDGTAEIKFTPPKEAKSVTLEVIAGVPGTPSSGKQTLPIAEAPKPAEVGQVEIFAESVKRATGVFSYVIFVLDSKTGRPVEDNLIIMPKKTIWVDNGRTNQCYNKGFRMPISINGTIVTIKTDEPGVMEIDLISERFPKSRIEVIIYGPTRETVLAERHDTPFVRLFKDCY